MTASLMDTPQCGKYNIIYADPPWTFKTYSDKGKDRSPEQHYDCMTLDDIKNMPVSDVAADDAAIFLWVYEPLLKEGIEVMEAWGFEYKSIAFNWVKQNKKSDSLFVGLGYTTRKGMELCLYGRRGKALPRHDKGVRQVVVDRIREHSRKPDRIREDIVRLYGDLPRLEMFGRTKIDGWDVFGNQIDKF